uniref:Gustatory receptor n=1 Tax=Trichogramma kaykai TaxID=54128 RepID=A0ABD2WVD3_9HYME
MSHESRKNYSVRIETKMTTKTLAKWEVVALLILLYSFKILGLVPYKFEVFTKPTYNWKFTPCRLSRLYNLVLGCALFVSGVLGNLTIGHWFEWRPKNPFDMHIFMIRLYLRCFAAIFTLVVFFFKVDDLIMLTHKVIEIKEMSLRVSKKASKSVKTALCKCIQLYIFFNGLWILIRFPLNIVEAQGLIVECSYFYSMNIINGIFMQYTFFLIFLKSELQNLNDTMMEISQVHVAQLIRLNEKKKKKEKLSLIFELHATLFNFSRDLSCFYALTILIDISTTFVTLILQTYILLHDNQELTWYDGAGLLGLTRNILFELILISIPLSLTVNVTDCIDEIGNALTTYVMIVMQWRNNPREYIATVIISSLFQIRGTSRMMNIDANQISSVAVWDSLKIFIAFSALWIITRLRYVSYEIDVFLWKSAYLLSDHIVNVIIVQYICFLLFIKQVIKLINSTMRDMEKLRSTQLKTMKLYQTASLYSKLSSLSEKLSSFFSLPMLMIIVYIYVSLIIESYYIATSTTSKFEVEFFLDVIYALTLALEVLSLTMAVRTVIEELKRLYIALNFQRMTFSVFRFFSLDEELMTSIASSLTTYLMIVLQWSNLDLPRHNGTNTTTTNSPTANSSDFNGAARNNSLHVFKGA